MEFEPEKKRISIIRKIAIPLLIVALLQPLVFLAVIQGSDIIGKSNREECGRFSDCVRRTGEDLSADMIMEWSELSFPQTQLDAAYQSFCTAQKLTDAAFAESDAAQRQFLRENSRKLVEAMLHNQTTGIYLVLNRKESAGSAAFRNGVCIRNEGEIGSYKKPENLYLKRGPSEIAGQLGISTQSSWAEDYAVSDKSCDLFFTKPILAASENPETPGYELGYWCPFYSLEAGDGTSLSYSIPLVSGSGTVFGVLGVEISQKYLRKVLPTGELGAGADYSIASVSRKNGKTVYELTVPKADSALRKTLGSRTTFTAGKKLSGGCREAAESDFPRKIIFSAETLQTKNRLVDGSQTLALVGITSANALFSFSRQVRNLLIIALFLALAVGLLGMFTVSHLISSPLIAMSQKIRSMDDRETVHLEGIGISEVDAMIDSINHLNQNVAKNEERLSTILKLTNYPIGVFSIDLESGYVYSSSGLFYILRGLIRPEEEGELSDLNSFVRMLDKLRQCPTETEEGGSTIYDINPYVGEHRWIRVRETEQEDSLLGVVTDVTGEVLHKKQIEYERDYDPLTGLMNRHAFQTVLEKMSRTPEELGTAAMLMFDVDGLKAINDKYGHDCGDRYICGIADILRQLEDPNAVISHVSGDEFVALLYGYDGKEEIREIIARLQEKQAEKQFEFPDGTSGELCLSGGLAWYPTDSTDLSILRRYADFAMYQAKENFRGTVCEFDAKLYYQDNLGERRKELERILTGEGLQCALHPIVWAADGELAALEAPIAPKSGVLITDEDLLSLARSQEKLYQVEQVNWKTALFAFRQALPSLPEDGKLFLRTVPEQELLHEDYLSLLRDSGVPAERIVPLVNASECDGSGRGAKKIQALLNLDLELALDVDACSAVNWENAMRLPFRYLLLSPQMTHQMVKGGKRNSELTDVLEEARNRQMRIAARGVSNREEYRKLRQEGIDLLQGPLLEKHGDGFPFVVKEF